MALFNIFVDFILEGPFWVEISSNERILRYVSGTKDLGIMYSTSKKFKLIGYIDNDN